MPELSVTDLRCLSRPSGRRRAGPPALFELDWQLVDLPGGVSGLLVQPQYRLLRRSGRQAERLARIRVGPRALEVLVTVEPDVPLLLILEDLHWADELSLDVPGRVAGRLATRFMESASASWRARNRFWEGAWAQLDLAAAAVQARRRGEAARLLDEVRTTAATVGATSLADAPDQLAGLFDGGSATPWFPLSRREFEVAKLVAAGLTNRQIAEQLVRAVPVRARCRCARRARRCAVAGALRPGTVPLLGH